MSNPFLCATVMLGDAATVGERDTHLWSHTPAADDTGRRSLQPLSVVVGPGAYLGGRLTFVGCSIPARALVGDGSVVTESFPPDAAGRLTDRPRRYHL